jgi:hypothetical protein
VQGEVKPTACKGPTLGRRSSSLSLKSLRKIGRYPEQAEVFARIDKLDLASNVTGEKVER